MPHQCTTCGHVFPDGSKAMLGGCPDCGGNAFQFHPEGADIPDEPPDADPPAGDEEVGGTVGRAASTVRNLVGGSADGPAGAGSGDAPSDSSATPRSDAPWPDQDESGDPDGDDADIIVAEETDPDAEDAAQASARSDLATPEDVSAGADPLSAGGSGAPAGPAPGDAPAADDDQPPAEEGRVVSEPTDDDRPDIAELREQLDDQFESIKIVEPGQYELNLMELYDREEYIIALQENGRYVIQVPEQWLGDRDEP